MEKKPYQIRGLLGAGFRHTLVERGKIKAIIPFQHVDLLTQKEIRAGALIVDSGKEGAPNSYAE